MRTKCFGECLFTILLKKKFHIKNRQHKINYTWYNIISLKTKLFLTIMILLKYIGILHLYTIYIYDIWRLRHIHIFPVKYWLYVAKILICFHWIEVKSFNKYIEKITHQLFRLNSIYLYKCTKECIACCFNNWKQIMNKKDLFLRIFDALACEI